MKFLTKYWKEVTIGLVFISMLIAIIVLFNKPQVTITVEDTKKIEALRDSVNVLNKQMTDLRIAYDNKQGEVITKIKYIKELIHVYFSRRSKETSRHYLSRNDGVQKSS